MPEFCSTFESDIKILLTTDGFIFKDLLMQRTLQGGRVKVVVNSILWEYNKINYIPGGKNGII